MWQRISGYLQLLFLHMLVLLITSFTMSTMKCKRCQFLQPQLIEGLPLLLELQDLPTFVVLPDSYSANVKMTMSQFANLDKVDWILINTFYKLECEVGNFVPHNWTLKLFALLLRFLVKSHSLSISIPNQLISSIPSQIIVNCKWLKFETLSSKGNRIMNI